MCSHLAGAIASAVCSGVLAVCTWTNRFVFLDYIGPEHTCCTEFGNFHEVVGADTKVEFDFLCSQCCGYSCFCQLAQVFITPCQGISQFLINVGTCIVQQKRINGQATEFWIGGKYFNQPSGIVDKLAQILSFLHHFLHWVIVDGALKLGRIISFFTEIISQHFCQLYSMPLASREVQFYTFAADVF